jgi:hypothetical protein
MHALNLDTSAIHFRINSSTDPAIYASSCFVFFLMSNRILVEKDKRYRDDGDLLLYFSGDLPVHAAKAVGTRAVSKWGGGLLVDHEILDAPANYGSQVRCFTPITTEIAEAQFVKYAACMGYQPVTNKDSGDDVEDVKRLGEEC